MKLKIKEIPVIMEGPGTVMRRQAGLGNMDIGYIELPKGADFTPLLKGLSNDNCCCPHWGIFSRAFSGLFMTMETRICSQKVIFSISLAATQRL